MQAVQDKGIFNRQHTPIEKGLMVAGGLMAGIVIGMVISPIRGGIGLEVFSSALTMAAAITITTVAKQPENHDVQE